MTSSSSAISSSMTPSLFQFTCSTEPSHHRLWLLLDFLCLSAFCFISITSLHFILMSPVSSAQSFNCQLAWQSEYRKVQVVNYYYYYYFYHYLFITPQRQHRRTQTHKKQYLLRHISCPEKIDSTASLHWLDQRSTPVEIFTGKQAHI